MATTKDVIRVDHLTKKFGDSIAVDDISFRVAEGEIFAFLGPNGAGKSTTIKMLVTLLHPTSGEISINGNDAVADPDSARRASGIVFQDPSLDDELTAYENMEFHGILYGMEKKLLRERIAELLELVELTDKKNRFVKEFSGGMKRRLEIARWLLHRPKVFFLDEPTLGLDPQTRNHIWAYVEKLVRSGGITVFFTTHYMEEAEHMADTIAVIDHGKIIATGTCAELLAKTSTKSLEGAFLALTGDTIREQEGSSLDNMRMMRNKRTK